MKYRRGDIVLADLPFSDRSGGKVRPALVVQNDGDNRRLDDVILALITSAAAPTTIEPTQLLIDITMPDGKQTGLLHSSIMKCEHLITLHRKFLRKVVGTLTSQQMSDVQQCLKAALDLS